MLNRFFKESGTRHVEWAPSPRVGRRRGQVRVALLYSIRPSPSTIGAQAWLGSASLRAQSGRGPGTVRARSGHGRVVRARSGRGPGTVRARSGHGPVVRAWSGRGPGTVRARSGDDPGLSGVTACRTLRGGGGPCARNGVSSCFEVCFGNC